LKKSGFSYADVSIPFYQGSHYKETVEAIKASCFNLENGIVKESEVDSKSIFKEALDERYNLTKFAVPAVKEGSIIEYQYTIRANDIYSLRDWEFQGQIPTLWSQYTVAIPSNYGYAVYMQGKIDAATHTKKQYGKLYSIKDSKSSGTNENDNIISLNATVFEDTWIMKEVPAMKVEAYTSTIDNYVTKLKFQLAKIFGDVERDVTTTWMGMRQELMQADYFGGRILEGNSYLDAEMKNIVNPEDDAKLKCQKIYKYVRSNFVWDGKFSPYCATPLRNVWKNKKGNVGEINFMLLSMLKHEGIPADPVIISTRSNGKSLESYPIEDQFNYVAVRVDLPSEQIYLDASHAGLAFGRLPSYCYNGHARVMNARAEAVYLNADDLQEIKMTYAAVTLDNSGFNVAMSEKQGYFGSFEVRTAVLDHGKDNFFKEKLQGYTDNAKLKTAGIDSLDKPDFPVTVHYDFTIEKQGGDILYLSPLLSETIAKNPFESAIRTYPVEMLYARSETFTFSFIIPDGYQIEELPNSEKISLGADGGKFEYLIAQNGATIQLRTTLILTKATYQPAEYEGLREFYARILKKQNEQIILKKKKS